VKKGGLFWGTEGGERERAGEITDRHLPNSLGKMSPSFPEEIMKGEKNMDEG